MDRIKKLFLNVCFYCVHIFCDPSYHYFQIKRFLRNHIQCRKQQIYRWFRFSFPGSSYLFADTDLLLSIHPIHKRHKGALTYHYPPPGYGLPPKYSPTLYRVSGQNKKGIDNYNKTITVLKNVEQYGLHLWPGRLWRVLWIYMLFMFPFMLLPLLKFDKGEALGELIYGSINIYIDAIDQALTEIFYGYYLIAILVVATIFFIFYVNELFVFINYLRGKLRKIGYGLLIFKRALKHNLLELALKLFLYLIIISFVLMLFYVSGWYQQSRHYLAALLSLILLSLIVFQSTCRKVSPVLNKVWKLWPESQYFLFLNVPHRVNLTWKDRSIDRSIIIGDNDLSKYWRCDENTALFQQSTYYAKGQKTLQEVLLHLALFDFLFHKKVNKSPKKQGIATQFSALKLDNWWFVFSPVWISFVMLLISITAISLFCTQTLYTDIKIIISGYPFNFIWAVAAWAIISYLYVSRWLSELERLNVDIRKGYFDQHLKLVPQQILGAMTEIPDSSQIQEAIATLKKVVNVALITLSSMMFMILEILSSFSFSSS